MKVSIALWSLLITTTMMAALDEQPLIISVCAYNASPWVELNLDSLFTQEYSNFHVIYVDDASTDDTSAKVQEYIAKHNIQDKITLIRNANRQRKMKNIYTIFHDCPDDTIIAQVDADDWLDDRTAFLQINEAHQADNVWLTYGQFKVYPSGQKGYCRPVPDDIREKRDYRRYRFIYTHMRTFRAWLVKSIKLQDLIAERVPEYMGKFFPISNDNAIYFPMLEMCGDRFTFIPNILYVHNHSNPNYGLLVDFDLSVEARKDIRLREKYPVLDKPVKNRSESFKESQAHAIILSMANPEGLRCLLQSFSYNAQGIAQTTVLYEAQTRDQLHCYKTMQTQHTDITFVPCTRQSCCQALKNVLESCTHDHCIVARDNVYLLKPLNITSCIQELERTFAYGYYFNYAQYKKPFYYKHIKKEMIPSQQISPSVCTWKFNCGIYALYNNIDMTLLRKTDLLTRLNMLEEPAEHTMQAFFNAWHSQQTIDGHQVGLLCAQPILHGKRSSILTHAVEKPVVPQALQNFYKRIGWDVGID